MGFGTLRRPGEMAFVLIVEPYGTSLPETIGHHRIGGGQTLITCCEDEGISRRTGGKVLQVGNGRIG